MSDTQHNNDKDQTQPKAKRSKTSHSFSSDIPKSAHYHVSFMHRQVVTAIVSSQKHGYVLTASQDGIVKFWKRLSGIDNDVNDTQEKGNDDSTTPCLEFVKSFTAHVGPVLNLTMSPSGDAACSVGLDGVLKLYDVSTFDVTGMIMTSLAKNKLGPHVAFCGQDEQVLAVSSDKNVLLYSTMTLSAEPIHTVTLHASPITSMVYNPIHKCMVSADSSGVLELWDASREFGSPVSTLHHGITWTSKMQDTQLYDLMKKKTFAIAMCVSPNGGHFCVFGADLRLRVFEHSTCRIVVKYDEGHAVYDKAFEKNSSNYGMDVIEYGKRAATEREMKMTFKMTGGIATSDVVQDSSSRQLFQVAFDSTGKFILVPTMLGIKVIEWKTHKVHAIVGKGDASHLRFVSFAQCWGDAKVNRQMQLARSGGSSAAVGSNQGPRKSDSLLVALAHEKKRLYVLSHVDPVKELQEQDDENAVLERDILNEPPDAEDALLLESSAAAVSAASASNKAGKEVILRTTMGDICIKLFTSQVPKTIENFCTHANNGYYDGIIFHRVIKGFMLQTGDPLGDGTGGESIWGGEFEDEFVRDLRHDRPFTVSMANAGPNTNGSQFFITTVPTPWLDNKHTVFGRVTRGMDVCTAIEAVKTDDMDKPLEEISIQSIDVS